MQRTIEKVISRIFGKPRKFFPEVNEQGIDKPRKFFPVAECEYLLIMRRQGVFGNGTANQL